MIMSGNEGLRRTEYGNTGGVQLLKVIHQIQVGKRATAFVDIVIAVGSDGDGANVGDARHVRWNELFPKLFAARGQVQSVDRGGNFAEPINQQRATVAGPRDGSFSSIEVGNGPNLTAIHR